MGSTIYHRGSLRAIVAGLACVILAILAGCTQVPPPPKLPSGWTLYRDKQFAFQMPIPPGWHTATMRDGPSDRPACVYVVGILPPGDHTQLTDLALSNDPELMYVMVNITCPDWGTIMPGLKETAVTVDGKAAQQYDSQIPDTLIGRSVVRSLAAIATSSTCRRRSPRTRGTSASSPNCSKVSNIQAPERLPLFPQGYPALTFDHQRAQWARRERGLRYCTMTVRFMP